MKIEVCACGHLKIWHVFWKWTCQHCHCAAYTPQTPTESSLPSPTAS